MCMVVLYAEFTSNDNSGSSQQPQITSGFPNSQQPMYLNVYCC